MSNFTNRRHGTADRYMKDGCRCDECRKAMTAYGAVLRRTRVAARGGKVPDPLLPHGRKSTYSNWGCRCDRCTAAARDAAQVERPSMRPRSTCAECGGTYTVNPSGALRNHGHSGIQCPGGGKAAA